ncbi:hypothetical protein Y032_0451g1685 [Ancylostoma ceylanicum]|uniref:Saposin B-type domain-containing protein n=1 Tax=Ancylostoma ceylanicum TaxID=53326 RepID=A0A016X0F6_9BILA|nr:hypothetical protein Y032_0451g1685 [Ancylostoma ceylanicum]
MKTFLLLLIAAFGYAQLDWSKCEVCAFTLTALRGVYGDDSPSRCRDCLTLKTLKDMICGTLAEDTSDVDTIDLCYILLKQVRRRGLMDEVMELNPKYDSRTDRFCARELAYCRS